MLFYLDEFSKIPNKMVEIFYKIYYLKKKISFFCCLYFIISVDDDKISFTIKYYLPNYLKYLNIGFYFYK